MYLVVADIPVHRVDRDRIAEVVVVAGRVDRFVVAVVVPAGL
jgi:hypothetical protein